VEIAQLANILVDITQEPGLHKRKREAHLPKTLRPKKKRIRHPITPAQLEVLESLFAQDSTTPELSQRKLIAEEIGMTSRRIQVWFQNKRAKIKKGILSYPKTTPSASASTPVKKRVGSSNRTSSPSNILNLLNVPLNPSQFPRDFAFSSCAQTLGHSEVRPSVSSLISSPGF